MGCKQSCKAVYARTYSGALYLAAPASPTHAENGLPIAFAGKIVVRYG